jgi:hypothetical protein
MRLIATMKTRPFSICGSQFGSHWWLMKRVSLPPALLSMTAFSSRVNRNVCGSFTSRSL